MRYMKKRAHRRRAFTLVEVVIVTAMVAIISLAIYSTLNNGLRIWKRVNESLPEEDIAIFMEKFAVDARNSFISKDMLFHGTKESMAIPSVVVTPWVKGRTIGQVVYSFDSSTKSVMRRVRDFSHVYRDEEGIIGGQIIHIRSAEMRYYSYDEEKKLYQWISEWQAENMPLAARITIVTDEQIPQTITRTVSFYAAG
jgi:prepilin-type N-terminal cleavage/methylation domain-containing protein